MSLEMASELHLISSSEPARLCDALCHELGNALAAVRLSAHLLAREPEREAAAVGVRDLEAVAARAGAALGQLRALLAPDPPAVSPSASPRAVLRALRHAVSCAGASESGLEMVALGALPQVRADGEALQHLLASHVFAAWDAAATPAPVRVSAEAGPEGVSIGIEDVGPPWRFSPASVGEPRGRALWLAVSATLVARWGGSVVVRCGDGGTRVELRLLPA